MSDRFALATLNLDGAAVAGLVIRDEIAPLPALAALADMPSLAGLGSATVFQLLQNWEFAFPRLKQLAALFPRVEPSRRIACDRADLRSPVDLPRQVFCTGVNYRKHVVQLTLDMNVGPEGLQGEALRQWAEDMMDERRRTGEPYVFTKPVSAIAGANEPLVVRPIADSDEAGHAFQ